MAERQRLFTWADEIFKGDPDTFEEGLKEAKKLSDRCQKQDAQKRIRLAALAGIDMYSVHRESLEFKGVELPEKGLKPERLPYELSYDFSGDDVGVDLTSTELGAYNRSKGLIHGK